MNPLIILYHFQHHDISLALPHLVTDPAPIYLNEGLVQAKSGHHFTAIQLFDLKCSQRDSTSTNSVGTFYQSDDIRFYRLIIMFSDNSVHQTVVSSLLPTEKRSRIEKLFVEPLTWHKLIKPKLGVASAGAIFQVEDDFVVPDGIKTKIESRLDRRGHSKAQQRSAIGPREIFQTIDYQFLYQFLCKTGILSSASKTSTAEPESISEFLSRIEVLLEKGNGNSHSIPQAPL